VADSLGEAFVEVLADTSPFGASLEEGISGALSDIESEVSEALGSIPEIADDAFSGVADAATGAAEETGSAFENVTDKIQENIGKITVGFGALGAASEGFARKQGETNATLGRVAAITGVADDELRNMIGGMVDHTFSAEDAAAGMERLARAGITEADSLAHILPLMDTFADATGGDVVGSIDLFDRALSALGIPLEEAGDHMDALGFLANQTTVPLGNVAMLMRREAASLREYGLSTEDIAVAMAALEAEGVRGPRTVMAFQAALADGEGSLEDFWGALGVSNDTLEEQRGRLSDAQGGIGDFADINNAAITPIQKVTNNLQNTMFRFGGLADAAGMLAAPIGALGPMMMGLNATQQLLSSGIMSKIIPAIGAKIGAFASLSVAILTNPIFLIGALLVGVAVLIWKFRDEIIEALVGAWEWIKEKVGALVEWFRTAIPNAIAAVVDWVKENWPLILAIITGPIGLAVKFIIDNWDRIKEIIRNAIDAVKRFVREGFENVRRTISNLVDRVRTFVTNAFEGLRDRARGAIENLRDSVRNILNNVVDFVKDLPARVLRGLGNLGSLLFDKGKDMIQGLLDGAKSLLKNIGSFFLNIVPGWIRGPFEKALGISSPSKVFADIGRDTMAGFSVGVDDELRRVQRTMAGMAQAIPMDLRTDQIQGSLQGGSSMIRSQEIKVTINNPIPEPASVSISREMRKLAATGVFDG
jgi:phage-related protein